MPLLTPFQTPSGEKLVWTTFSSDQVDLNFADPEVLLAIGVPSAIRSRRMRATFWDGERPRAKTSSVRAA